MIYKSFSNERYCDHDSTILILIYGKLAAQLCSETNNNNNTEWSCFEKDHISQKRSQKDWRPFCGFLPLTSDWDCPVSRWLHKNWRWTSKLLIGHGFSSIPMFLLSSHCVHSSTKESTLLFSIYHSICRIKYLNINAKDTNYSW